MGLPATPERTSQLLQNALTQVEQGSPEAMAAIARSGATSLQGMPEDSRRQLLTGTIRKALETVQRESQQPAEVYHSRDAVAGLVQSLVQSYEDKAVPELQAYGENNPLVWLPTGLDAVLDHFRQKAPFQIAGGDSLHTLPDQCKIALLSDWGAPNDHAQRIGRLAVENGADYIIHLGDIYYSGTDAECRRFLADWPLRDGNGKPAGGHSFALNGNHEMYSGGRGYFQTVLPAFGQEASYFTLANDHWQIHGLDTAYVPFSISGGNQDSHLAAQWQWLIQRILAAPAKRNILLTHNQPESAHAPEFTAAQALKGEWWQLTHATSLDSVFAWFFGHEHRCVIYDDEYTHFKARLIGNGSIPHAPQTETSAQIAENGTTCTPARRFNHGKIGDAVAISTFCLLTLDREHCRADYINEDGSLFYAEMLSGGKNAEITPS